MKSKKYEYDIVDRMETLYSAEDDIKFLNNRGSIGWKLINTARIPVRQLNDLKNKIYYNRYIFEKEI